MNLIEEYDRQIAELKKVEHRQWMRMVNLSSSHKRLLSRKLYMAARNERQATEWALGEAEKRARMAQL